LIRIYKAQEVKYEKAVSGQIGREVKTTLSDRMVSIEEKERQAEEILLKAQLRAKEILDTAEENANILLAQTAEKSQEMYDAVHKKAKEEGYAAGRKEAEKLIEESDKKAKEIIKEAYEIREKIISSMSSEILDLSFSIAEKVLNYELERNTKAFMSLINSAASKTEDDNAKILVSAEDYMNHQQVLSEDDRVEPDDSLKKGEIKVISKKGIVDASLDKQLEKAKIAAGERN
jgi:flagellar biosynthesis/type III secretory pathway protein FliH